ncbi:uncharacterized protein LOC116286787 [Actinia tenebrosa]|uniref:Uncharacterized protein LOC116286787 n=1 Tax=Actinia tenebrosa TaxID=6105 RepID=A0A6P8H9Q9_ACTTE|nr:uncharacterized protein LOC116286787 [Actinia tenebrosa]
MASLSIASLSSFFVEEQKSISRGENHYQSAHVESFSYDQGVLRGEVKASMKNKVYKVTIYLDENNKIRSSQCECPRGEYKCSHAAALFIHGIHNLSRTDVECSWRKKKTDNTSPLSVIEMFPPSKDYVALRRTPTKEDRGYLYSELRGYGKFTGICWILRPEPAPPRMLPIPTIEEIIYSEEFLDIQGQQQQIAFVQEKVQVSDEIIREIARSSQGQRDNPLWHLVRKGRLTASNFGCVMNAKRATPSLIKRLLGEYDVSRVKAVLWGVTNESEAVKSFKTLTGLPVEETGVWLDKTGVLGASPDGLVGRKHVLEVKCPYTQRNCMIAEAVTNDSFCLKTNNDGKYELKTDHVYWHQVQGQMFLTQREFCYFVVWTTKETAILNIKRDPSWLNNIDILVDFYFFHIFPKILEGEL